MDSLLVNQTQSDLRNYFLETAKVLREQNQNKTKEAKKEEIASIEKDMEAMIVSKKIEQYETLFYEKDVNDLTLVYYNNWVEECKIKNNKETLEKGTEEMSNALSKNKAKLSEDLTICRSKSNWKQWRFSYISERLKIEPNYTGDLTQWDKAEEIWNTIDTLAQNEFDSSKKEALDMAQELSKVKLQSLEALNLQWNIKFDNEKIQQKIAQIPLTIEEKIQGIKDTLDKLLGRYLSPILNPDSMDFDMETLLAKIKTIINPLIASISPLETLAGKVPILGDLAAIMTLLSQCNGDNQITKSELKKLLPKKPALPENLMECIKGIFDDILAVAMQLPMVLINVIFQMLDTIVGLFKQIAGVIGVPGIPYPLSLIPNCIQAVTQVSKFIYNIPTLLYAAIKGMLMDKLAQAMVMAVPKPNIDMDTLSSLIPDIKDPEPNKPTEKSKPDTPNISYYDVVKDSLDKVQQYGYDRTDINKILNSYKDIYNGGNDTITKYSNFHYQGDNDIRQPETESITRTVASPEDFKSKMDSIIGQGTAKNYLKYDQIKKVQRVIGAPFYTYEDEIKQIEPGEEVVIEEIIEGNGK